MPNIAGEVMASEAIYIYIYIYIYMHVFLISGASFWSLLTYILARIYFIELIHETEQRQLISPI
jgi:hypothetical protein